MNYSNPILICDANEEFRILVRDMLTKNGFFHILEASNDHEVLEVLNERKDYFVLIESKALAPEIMSKLKGKRDFIVFSQKSDESILTLSAQLGIEHFMSYPFHSRKLLEKISGLI